MRLLLLACLALGLVPLSALAKYVPEHSVSPKRSASKVLPVPFPTARPDLEPDFEPDFEMGTRAFANGVSVLFDIAYVTSPGSKPLTLDIYTPRPQPAPIPILVYVHGGSWKNGDSRHSPAFADFPRALAALAAKGYVVASINYRLSPQAHFPAALQDVKSAIRWLRGHAASYGGDMTRVAVWGASAGGQLAAMAGTTCGVMGFEPEADRSSDLMKDIPSDCAEAVIDWSGPTDLRNPSPDNSGPTAQGSDAAAASVSEVGNYLGCEPAACAPGVVRLSSPLTFLSVNAPPFLIQHGAADTEVPLKQSQDLYDALKRKGVPAEIVIYPDVGHLFLRGNTPDTDTVNQAMVKLTEFLAATFPPAPRHEPTASPKGKR